MGLATAGGALMLDMWLTRKRVACSVTWIANRRCTGWLAAVLGFALLTDIGGLTLGAAFGYWS